MVFQKTQICRFYTGEEINVPINLQSRGVGIETVVQVL